MAVAASRAALNMASPERPQQHKRNKSASMLKSIMPSKPSKHSKPEDGATDPASSQQSQRGQQMAMLPSNNSNGSSRVLEEIHNVGEAGSSPRKSHNERRPRLEGFYKMAKSSESTCSLAKEGEKDGRRTPRENGSPTKPKKTKSSSNLANLFARNRSSKDLTQSPSKSTKDKENTTPPASSHAQAAAPPPIWAQFATQKPPETYEEQSTTSKVPLNDERERTEEASKHSAAAYTPSKQRNSSDDNGSKQSKRGQRPKSIEVAAASAKNLFQPLSRKASHGKEAGRKSSDEHRGRDAKVDRQPVAQRGAGVSRESQSASPVKNSRVMAAVATINDKAKDAELDMLINSKDLDARFEAVLESRNIPEPMRERMRTLTARVKADFIRSHTVDGRQSPPGTAEGSATMDAAEDDKSRAKKKSKAKGSTKSKNGVVDEDDDAVDGEPTTPKRSRPRSRTFTFNKGDSSPLKKFKGDADSVHNKREKSTDRGRSNASSTTATSGRGDESTRPAKGPNAVAPSEFVQYLHDATNVQDIEVGRLHKLRILLRNETVGWVDTFIAEGGMTEIVALLHRIMDVEWRDEHDDALLHEALLCLKGILTTALALQKLCEVEATLFPALLGMLFSKERKGPAEYTTRTVMINILFMHLAAAVHDAAELPRRARRILAYLEDPLPPEAQRTHAWITDMQQRRPYRVWTKEVANVTKEVFWIFLHHLNVVSLPAASSAEPKPVETSPPPGDKPLPPTPGAGLTTTTTTTTTSSTTASRPATASDSPGATYTAHHFPPLSRPPVPAAPYVGGVEWDATQYLAAHLDLLNALVAALPTRAERADQRGLLRASGAERVLAQLRTCKEKLYGAVHCGLRTWVGAAAADGWEVRDVRFGPKEGGSSAVSPSKGSPVKGAAAAKKADAPPRLEVPGGSAEVVGGLGVEFEIGRRIGGGEARPGEAAWQYDDFGTRKK